jgi:BASS family bile acid:Na+ symporter
MWALIGDGTVLALTIFTLAGLAIGHILGGPETPHSVVVALSTACRHPAIALTVAASNFPEYQFGPIILLYLIVNALAAIPYLKWQQQTVASAAPAT